MKNLITGGIGLTASELVNVSNIDNVASAITQIIIAIMTIISLFSKSKINK